MTFDEAFERLKTMAAGRRCAVWYHRHSDPDLGEDVTITCFVDSIYCSPGCGTFEAALVEVAAVLAGYEDKPEIVG